MIERTGRGSSTLGGAFGDGDQANLQMVIEHTWRCIWRCIWRCTWRRSIWDSCSEASWRWSMEAGWIRCSGAGWRWCSGAGWRWLIWATESRDCIQGLTRDREERKPNSQRAGWRRSIEMVLRAGWRQFI